MTSLGYTYRALFQRTHRYASNRKVAVRDGRVRQKMAFIVMTNHGQLPQLSSITAQLHFAYLSSDVFNSRSPQIALPGDVRE